MKKVILALLTTVLLSSFAAAFTFQTAKVVKWENSTYQQKKNKLGQWVVYSIQTDSTTYQVARKKETKPKMQPGETVQLEVKGNKANVINAKATKSSIRWLGRRRAGAVEGSGQLLPYCSLLIFDLSLRALVFEESGFDCRYGNSRSLAALVMTIYKRLMTIQRVCTDDPSSLNWLPTTDH